MRNSQATVAQDSGNDSGKTPDARVVIRDFPGYVPNMDPHDLPPGAAVRQVNVMSSRPGELRVRPGFAVVKFSG